jgi:hypothetical protein
MITDSLTCADLKQSTLGKVRNAGTGARGHTDAC